MDGRVGAGMRSRTTHQNRRGGEKCGDAMEGRMSLVNQETGSAVLGSPCPRARQTCEGQSTLPATFCDSDATGNEGRENAHGLACLV